MALWLRVLLWMVVALVPGGMLLLPVLVGDALRRSKIRSPEKDVSPPVVPDDVYVDFESPAQAGP